MRPVDSKYPVTLGYRQKANFDPTYIHRGIDYGCPSGTKVVATAGGRVVYAGNGGGYGPAYGIQVVILTKAGVYCLYAHLSKERVNLGQTVKMGDHIAYSGATGNVRGDHLHYQENTKPPAQYTSDRKPQYPDVPLKRVRKYRVNDKDGSTYIFAGPGRHHKIIGHKKAGDIIKSYEGDDTVVNGKRKWIKYVKGGWTPAEQVTFIGYDD